MKVVKMGSTESKYNLHWYYQCKVCSETFPSSKVLKTHLYNHTKKELILALHKWGFYRNE